ncbi:DUF4296 domain-containing protein [Sediminibacterium soli]|uniref:DUF4296 domain-containing protein n=1 Tax=Sediminibacterium soli TaxID=2698829 RepID=UPI00137AACCA|nr:DUF4296 domain-containing protein [Sediminibacterium soli]NCI45719.1 DUF4296 domain-containing protein [Sediminibacterium soli]
MRTVLYCVCVLLVACSGKKAKKHIPLNDMKLIVWDMIKAGEWYNVTTVKDTTARKRKEDIRLFSQVLTVHGITRDEFYSSYKYYEAHPVEFKVLIDSLDAYSAREKNAESERKAKSH